MAYVCYSQLTKARNQQQKLKKKKNLNNWKLKIQSMDQRINYNGNKKIFLKHFEEHKVNTVLKYLWGVKTYLKLWM